VQVTADGAVEVEGDGNEGEQSYASGCSSTRAEAACRGRKSPVARIGLR
jgi:hypothetical protein